MIIHAIFRRASYVVVCRLCRHEGTLYWVRESAFIEKGCSYDNIERAREVFPGAIFLDREIRTQKAFFINGDWVSVYTEFLEGDLDAEIS